MIVLIDSLIVDGGGWNSWNLMVVSTL
jgi:hypothetical protein